ncbi:MAG TPA: DUF3276 family protein [Bacteroidia bacterium]|nr:DUF3276 family protein [Bacteroidia bacterium]
MSEFDSNEQRGEIFSKAIRAGKRTYFFDVRSTRSNDYYLTITESKKRFTEGSEKPFYEKHKLFLYKEDFEKFMDGLSEAIAHIRTAQPDTGHNPHSGSDAPADTDKQEPSSNRYSDINFDDLGKP